MPTFEKFTYARSTPKWTVNQAGVLTQSAIDYPSGQWSGGTYQGILMETASTNYVPNNVMDGAVPITNTLPGGWSANGGSNNDLTTTVVGTGTELGVDYIDIQVSGSAGHGSTSYLLRYVPFGFIPVTPGVAPADQLTASIYTKTISSSGFPVISFGISFQYATGGSFTSADNQTLSTTGTLTRYKLTSTVPAGVDSAYQSIRMELISGQAFTYRFRLGLPQTEYGIRMTSPIKTGQTALEPVIGEAVSRAGDQQSLLNANQYLGQTAGSIFAEFYSDNDGNVRWIFQIDDPSAPTSNRVLIGMNSTNQLIAILTHGGTQITLNAGAINPGRHKAMIVYQSGFIFLALDGSIATADSSTFSFTAVLDRIMIGHFSNGSQANMPITGWYSRAEAVTTNKAQADTTL